MNYYQSLASKAAHFPPRPYQLLAHEPFRKLAEALHELAVSQHLAPKTRCLIAARAVVIFRRLYSDKPDEHHVILCKALKAYAPQLRAEGRELEAAYCLREVVDAHRTLHNRDRRYTEHFLESLSEYAERMSALGNDDEVCAAVSEIVQIYEDIYRREPPANHHFVLAGHRRHYIKRLSKIDRHDDAWAQEAEIVEMTRRLHASDPANHHDTLVDCLNAYADRLTSAQRYNDACRARLHLVQLERSLYNASSLAHMGKFVTALRKYVDILSRAGRDDDARVVEYDIVKVYRSAYAVDAENHCFGVMGAVQAYIDRLVKLEREDDTCDYLAELIGYARGLYERDHQHHFRLSGYLENYSKRMMEMDREKEAGEAVMEVLKLYHFLWETEGKDFLKRLEEKISVLQGPLLRAGIAYEASGILVDIYRQRHEESPTAYNAKALYSQLITHAHNLHEEERPEACDAAIEAVELMKAHPIPTSSYEARRRTEQFSACLKHIAWGKRYYRALDAASEALRLAEGFRTTTVEDEKWAEKWRPKTARKHSQVKKVVSLKDRGDRVREAQKLGLTGQTDADVQERRRLFWLLVRVAPVLVLVVAFGIALRIRTQSAPSTERSVTCQ